MADSSSPARTRISEIDLMMFGFLIVQVAVILEAELSRMS
jgi:hypothetical protein